MADGIGNQEFYGLIVPFKCGTGGSTKGAAMTLDSSGNAIIASAIADKVIGVATQTRLVNEACPLLLNGYAVAKMVASGTVTILDEVMVKASGAGAVATASGATAKNIGLALSTAATTGAVMVLLGGNVNGPVQT